MYNSAKDYEKQIDTSTCCCLLKKLDKVIIEDNICPFCKKPLTKKQSRNLKKH